MDIKGGLCCAIFLETIAMLDIGPKSGITDEAEFFDILDIFRLWAYLCLCHYHHTQNQVCMFNFGGGGHLHAPATTTTPNLGIRVNDMTMKWHATDRMRGRRDSEGWGWVVVPPPITGSFLFISC